MSLRDRLAQLRGSTPGGTTEKLYSTFGVRRNPFPPAGQPSGHPHLDIGADSEIERRIVEFERDQTSQVIVIEGTQGVGKTNLLNFYQEQLEEIYRGQKGAYIVRYYPDPEPTFDGVLRKIVEELGEGHFAALGKCLAALNEAARAALLAKTVKSQEVVSVLRSLANASDQDRADVAGAAIEWMVGMRLLKRHSEALGVKFRLDTVESKNQALRDVIECSIACKQLKGIFLLLDELEKQDMTLSKTTVLRYLAAIRALIDALPRNFFLMIAITPDAKRRYFSMVPALQGRLATSVVIKPVSSLSEGMDLYRFYLEQTRQQETAVSEGQPTFKEVLAREDVKRKFEELLEVAERRGQEGVPQREFLNALHDLTEDVFAKVPG